MSSLGTYVFASSNNLTSVTVSWADPLTIDQSQFTNRANATLYVPNGTKALYEATDIVGISSPRYIVGDVYNVQGLHVGKDVDMSRLPKGIYIVNGKKYTVK